MTYQDQLIKSALDRLESAIVTHINYPCIHNAQKIAEAKHAIYELFKGVPNAK